MATEFQHFELIWPIKMWPQPNTIWWKYIYLEGPLLSPKLFSSKSLHVRPTHISVVTPSISSNGFYISSSRMETMTVREWGSQFTLAWTLFFLFKLFSPGPVIQHKLDFFGAYMVLDCWIHFILFKIHTDAKPFGALGSGLLLSSLSGLSFFKDLGSDGINYGPHIGSIS